MSPFTREQTRWIEDRLEEIFIDGEEFSLTEFEEEFQLTFDIDPDDFTDKDMSKFLYDKAKKMYPTLVED